MWQLGNVFTIEKWPERCHLVLLTVYSCSVEMVVFLQLKCLESKIKKKSAPVLQHLNTVLPSSLVMYLCTVLLMVCAENLALCAVRPSLHLSSLSVSNFFFPALFALLQT